MKQITASIDGVDRVFDAAEVDADGNLAVMVGKFLLVRTRFYYSLDYGGFQEPKPLIWFTCAPVPAVFSAKTAVGLIDDLRVAVEVANALEVWQAKRVGE